MDSLPPLFWTMTLWSTAEGCWRLYCIYCVLLKNRAATSFEAPLSFSLCWDDHLFLAQDQEVHYFPKFRTKESDWEDGKGVCMHNYRMGNITVTELATHKSLIDEQIIWGQTCSVNVLYVLQQTRKFTWSRRNYKTRTRPLLFTVRRCRTATVSVEFNEHSNTL